MIVVVVVPTLIIEDGVVPPPAIGDSFTARLGFVDGAGWEPVSRSYPAEVEELDVPAAWREHWGAVSTSSPPMLVRIGPVTARSNDPALPRGPGDVVGVFRAGYDVEVGPTVPPTSGTVRRVRAVTRAADGEPPALRDVEVSPRWFNLPPAASGARPRGAVWVAPDGRVRSGPIEDGVVIDLEVGAD